MRHSATRNWIQVLKILDPQFNECGSATRFIPTHLFQLNLVNLLKKYLTPRCTLILPCSGVLHDPGAAAGRAGDVP
jgi:hypothetical protein